MWKETGVAKPFGCYVIQNFVGPPGQSPTLAGGFGEKKTILEDQKQRV